MALSAAQQRAAVSEGAALGLAMCERYMLPSASWRLSCAFEGAWLAWDDRWRSRFVQVDADLRNGLDGYVALTHADGRARASCLYWEWSGPAYVILARESFVDADDAARCIDEAVPAAAWQSLARGLLLGLDP